MNKPLHMHMHIGRYHTLFFIKMQVLFFNFIILQQMKEDKEINAYIPIPYFAEKHF